MIHDVIIVGSGPAGAVLAYLLAKRGLQVLVLEKTALPRYKPCGGGVTFKAARCLPVNTSPVWEKEATGGIISYGGVSLLRTEVQRPFAWLVSRDRFDFYILERAVGAGAYLAEGSAVRRIEQHSDHVVVQTSKGEFRARYLAGADGVYSVIARQAGLLASREVGFALEMEVEVPPISLESQGSYATFDFGALPGGYGWIFPKLDHLSVGVFQARTGKARHIRQFIERFLANQGVLRNYRQISCRGQHIPLGGKPSPLHSDRVLLLGDAANLADPWLGEGIYYAIASAHIAAEVLCEALKQGLTDISNYTRRVNAEIVQDLAHARHFANLVYRFPHLGSALVSKSTRMQRIIFGAIRGDYKFRELNRMLLRQLPFIVFQSLKQGGEQ